MFGDTPDGAPTLRVCCGPRCGAEANHREVYAVVETTVADRGRVQPAMCQGMCGLGVTLVLPGGAKVKLRDVDDARDQIAIWEETTQCLP